MANKFASVEVRMERGKLVLNGMGRTNRGQKYIKKQAPIDAKQMGDENYKPALKTALAKLFE
jgi:hypothetical protein